MDTALMIVLAIGAALYLGVLAVGEWTASREDTAADTIRPARPANQGGRHAR